MDDPYSDLLRELSWCAACGRSSAPRRWPGIWRLERAHLSAGSARMRRERDRRAVVTLCSLHHQLHSHSGGWIRLYGEERQQLSDANVLWCKMRRDPAWWSWEYVNQIWLGAPPIPEEPLWLRGEYASNRNIPSWTTCEDVISLLEGYGAESRMINALESAGIQLISQLQSMTRKQLLQVDGIGQSGARVLLQAVSKYRTGECEDDLSPCQQARRNKIRDGWSDVERQRRSGCLPPDVDLKIIPWKSVTGEWHTNHDEDSD